MYCERTGGTLTHIDWCLEGTDPRRITSTQADERYQTWCDRLGACGKWEMTNRKGRISATRTGRSIRLTGTWEGKVLDKTAKIDDGPWFQALSFSLRVFVFATPYSVEFWTIRQDTLGVVKMRATRGPQETIAIGGVEVPAQKVRISPVGALGTLWHADYWYRRSDGVLLRYAGTHGLPGTPETVVELVVEPPAVHWTANP